MGKVPVMTWPKLGSDHWQQLRNGNYCRIYWVNMGIMEKKMENTIIYNYIGFIIGITEKEHVTFYSIYWVNIGMMEKRMETRFDFQGALIPWQRPQLVWLKEV